MTLTEDDVRGIADYARIALTDEELKEMCAYMNEAIELLEPIRQYDLTGVAPTFHPIGGMVNVMVGDEPDAHGRSLGIDEVLAITVDYLDLLKSKHVRLEEPTPQ